MDDVYENIDEYNPTRKGKVLIVFDDMIADIMTNKKVQAIVKELFIRCRKLNISLVFITCIYLFIYYLFIYLFFTIDRALPASDPLRFRKNLFHSYKNDSS